MQFLRATAFLTILANFVLFSACGGPPDGQNSLSTNSGAVNSRTAATNKANTNVEELGMLINFQLESDDLAWKRDEKKNLLTAVFRLSPEDSKKLTDQLTPRSPGAPKEVTVEEWFPAELVAQGESSGGSSVQATAYPADDFYQAPFTAGTISRVDGTDFFVIELSSK